MIIPEVVAERRKELTDQLQKAQWEADRMAEEMDQTQAIIATIEAELRGIDLVIRASEENEPLPLADAAE